MRTYLFLTALASVAAVGGNLTATNVLAKSTGTTSGTTETNLTQHIRHMHSGDMTHPPRTPAQMQLQLQKRLDAAVAAGNLTTAQETVVLAKAPTFEQQAVQIETLPANQRKAAFTSLKSSMTAWATSNGIDVTKLMGMSRDLGHHSSHVDGTANPPAGK